MEGILDNIALIAIIVLQVINLIKEQALSKQVDEIKAKIAEKK